MTAEEKFINNIRNYLIEKYGEEFLQLAEEEQNNLIFVTVREFIEKIKVEK